LRRLTHIKQPARSTPPARTQPPTGSHTLQFS
jgi:hypothetical protein